MTDADQLRGRVPAVPAPITSTVLTATLRIAGPVHTHVTARFAGQDERLVVARIGDALLYITDPGIAQRIRVHWDALQPLVLRRLPEQVSQTWLAPPPGTYPMTVSQRLSACSEVSSHWAAAHLPSRTPTHLQVRTDRLVWQVVDQQAWRSVGDAWLAIERHLHR
jgi:hypothetical protein